jgi:hypothetical protein
LFDFTILGKGGYCTQKCKRLVLNHSNLPGYGGLILATGYIVSVLPKEITVQCQEIGSPQTLQPSYQKTLEGTGVLLNSSSCYIHAESFKLLPRSLGQTTVNLTTAHIVLPNTENILNQSEESLLQPDIIQPVVLQHMDGIIERAT